ncbi:aldo/keto reductase [Streptomyces vinaceus]|uniref:Aldo/keto reductase n=1 Tax=Streptomyces vinaceus TaxID=1960 RepID=A0A5J6J4R5_STRVI|nr:aldo/keto reductase [Streptomyces vinaceus]QEV45032.1 aldo/keto reductase [Streptomyces vinaceus]GHE51202.1 aldo/keto reductase [Streptomyces vinaceus]
MTSTVPRRPARKAGIDLPVLGLGTWRTIDRAGPDRLAGLLEAARTVGARLVDTAPVYSDAEPRLARLLRQDPSFFVATKIWDTEPEAVEAVFAEQLTGYGRSCIDLLQVHNLNGWRANLAWLDRQKAAGRVRFTGVTYQFDHAFGMGGTRADLAHVIAADQVDFVQVNMNAAEPTLAEDILPAAAEAGIGVVVMRPFGEGALLAEPPSAGFLRELGCTSWSEALLRWVLTHPEVTTVLTATSRPEHFLANAAAARSGPLGPAEAEAVADHARSVLMTRSGR